MVFYRFLLLLPMSAISVNSSNKVCTIHHQQKPSNIKIWIAWHLRPQVITCTYCDLHGSAISAKTCWEIFNPHKVCEVGTVIAFIDLCTSYKFPGITQLLGAWRRESHPGSFGSRAHSWSQTRLFPIVKCNWSNLSVLVNKSGIFHENLRTVTISY